jgi:hypothetical protein
MTILRRQILGVRPVDHPAENLQSGLVFTRSDVATITASAAVTVGALLFENGGEGFSIVLAVLIVIAGLRSARAAWIAYSIALFCSGLDLELAGFTVLLEHFALIPVAVHALRFSATRVVIKRPVGVGAPLLACGAFVLWILVSTATSYWSSPDVAQSFKLLAWTAVNLVAAVLVFRLGVRPAKMVHDLLTVLTAHGAILLAIWVYVIASSQPNSFVERDYASQFYRLKGLMLEPNLVAALFVLGACVGLVYEKHLPRRLYPTYLAITGMVVLSTFTRVSGVLVVIVIAVYVWPRIRTAMRVFVIAGLLIVLVVATGSPTGDPGEPDLASVIAARASSLLDINSGTGAFRARTVDLAVADMDYNGFVVGHGFNAFPQVHESGLTSDGRLYLGLLWLVIFYDGGLVGGAVFLIGIAAVWVSLGLRNGFLFMVAFGLIATTTNPIWYAFPWVLAVVIMLMKADEVTAGLGDAPSSAGHLARALPGSPIGKGLS